MHGTAIRRLIAALCLLAFSAAAAYANKIGVVVLHGKNAPPPQLNAGATGPVKAFLEVAGYLVEMPEMCWSNRRIYDATYQDCMKDIDAAIERLKKRGANAIVLFGQSIGGNMAIGYAANRGGLKGIIVTGGGHNPGGIAGANPPIAKAYRQAQELVASGKGNARIRFPDNNADTGLFFVRATPRVYVSWYDPVGGANMALNAPNVTVPLLWISGDRDSGQRFIQPVLLRLPKHELTRHAIVKGGTHLGTPAASRGIVLPWLKELAKAD